jgi:hypothetical protein
MQQAAFEHSSFQIECFPISLCITSEDHDIVQVLVSLEHLIVVGHNLFELIGSLERSILICPLLSTRSKVGFPINWILC